MQRVPVGRAAIRRCPCAITVRRGISAARGELSLARSAAAPGRAQPVRTSAGTRLRRTAAANSGWTLCHSASLRGRCSPRRLPKVAHASAKHIYSGRSTSRTDHRFWRIVGGWSSRRRVGAAGGRSHEGAAQRRARAGRRRCRASVLRTSVEMAERKPTGRRLSSFAQRYAGAGRHEAGDDAVRSRRAEPWA